MKQLLLVFLGGGAGSALRYLISKYLNPVHMGIPYGTLAVNILGSLLVGLVIGLAIKTNPISQNTMLLLATGFCGGFTTFSAFAYENQVFLRSGDFTSFAFYTLGTLVLGLAAVFFGIWMVRYF